MGYFLYKFNSYKIIKKLVFILILFALFFGFSKTAYALTEATFLPSSYNLGSGHSFNYKLRELDPISFRKATTAEYNSALPNLTSDNIVSTADSDYPIYLWLDANDTALYYSEADKIYANADSERMFYDVKHLVNADVSGFDTSRVTNMEQMFFNSNALISLDLSSWDTSNVTNMGAMFEQCNGLVSIDFTGWDVRNVTMFSRMFCDCSVTSLDLSSFVTSSATLMSQMFANAHNLTLLNISNFDTSNVTNMWAMFEGTQIEELDVTSFDVSKVTDMSRMFNGCNKLRTLDLSSFEPKSAVYMSQMFNYCLKLTTIYVDPVKWGTPRPRYSNQMFGSDYRIMGQNGTTYVGSDDGTFNLSRARVDDPENDKPGYLTDVALKGQLYHSITYPDGRVFIVEHNAGLDLEPNETTNGTYQSGEITFIYHNGVTEPTTISQTVTMVGDGYTADGIHYYDNGISWNNSFWIRATKDITLEYAYKPEVLPGQDFPIATKEGKIFTGWYTEEDGGTKVTSYSGTEPLTLHAHYDNRTSFLEEGSNISSIIGDITNYSDSLNTFRKATESEYNNIKDSLTENNIASTEDSHFPTYMWYDGENVLYYSDADYIYINDNANNMFSSKLFVSIDLSGLYTNNVYDMASMFAYNERLQEVYFGDNFDTSNVTDMSYMFYNCSSLNNIDFYNIDMSSVTTTSEMFYNCSSLTSIDFKRKPLRSLQNAYEMFYGCSSLTYLDLTMFDNSNLYDYGYMFNNMSNLETIYVSDLWNEDNYSEQSNVFTNSTKLVGGAGTTYDENHDNSEYARVDDPNNDKPGYFTYREFRPIIYHPNNNWSVDYGSSYTFENNYQRDNTHLATVTLNKNYDGSESKYTYVDKQFVLTKWQVEKNEYDFGDTIIVDQDIYLEPIGVETIIGADLSPIYRENYKFAGWYTDPENGDLVESYDTEEDITLYAHWTEATTVPVTTPKGVIYVPYGEEYNLGVNDLYDFYAEAEYVTLDYNLGDDSDPPMTMMAEYKKGNGWLIDGVHYDDNSVITVTEPITIDYDYVIDKPPYVLPHPTNGNKYFAGWYAWGDFDSEPYEEYYGGGDITFVAKWVDDPVNLTIDGKTKVVERGSEYVVPSGQITDDNYITIYVSDRDKDREPVKIGYGKTVNYQNINGTNYEPGYIYIVNEDTTIITNTNNAEEVIMNPYIERPTSYEDEYGSYIFVGWILGNWDYVDPTDVNTDIYTLTPEDRDYNGQEFLAEYQMFNPETNVKVHIIDEFRRNDYIKIYEKGSTFNLEEDSRESNLHFDVGNNINDDYFTYEKHAIATVDHYLVNGESYDPNTTITLNEDIELEYVRVITSTESCGDEDCPDTINLNPNSRYNDYIYRGTYTNKNGEGSLVDIKNTTPTGDSYGSIYQTVYQYFIDGTNNIILTVDEDVSIISKGMGVIPDAKEKEDEVIPITLVYQDNETPNGVANMTYRHTFEGYRKPDYWRVYNPGEEYDYEEDTIFNASYNDEWIYDNLPEIDDDHFKGWWTEPEGGERVDELEYMRGYYEDYGYDTLYAHWGEPTVEICHGKGDCEEIIKGTAVVLERPEPTVTTAHFTLDYNTEEPGYDPKNVTTTKTETVEYFMINDERYDFGETYVFNENVDMYGVTTTVYTSDFEGYYSDNWDYGLNINGYELRGWCATTDGRYCRYYDEGDDIVQPDGLTLYATYYQSEGDTVKVTVDWNTTYDWPKGESEVLPDEKYNTIDFEVPEDYDKNIYFERNDGSGETLNGSIHVTNEFIGYRVGNDDSRRYQRHDLYTFYKDIHIQSQYDEVYQEITFPEMNEPTFKGWYTRPEGGRKISTTEDFVKYMDLNNEFHLYAQYYEGLPTDMELDTDNVLLMPGETHQIDVTFTPEGHGDTLTYTGYDDTKISVVNGLITGLSEGTTTITVGTKNTDIEKTITVTVINGRFASSTYSVVDKEKEDQTTDRIIIGAEPETLISDFKSNLDNPSEYIKIYDGDNELSDDDIVKTGLTIRLEVNGTIYDEAIIIIRGDINQDGLVNLMDKSVLSEQLLRLSDIEGYGVYAADIDNNDSINLMDKSKLSEYLLRLIDTLNE